MGLGRTRPVLMRGEEQGRRELNETRRRVACRRSPMCRVDLRGLALVATFRSSSTRARGRNRARA